MRLVCVKCKREFESLVFKKFCSEVCRKAYRNKKKNRVAVCPVCQSTFFQKTAEQKYCSYTCRNKAKTAHIHRPTKKNQKKQKQPKPAPLGFCPWEAGLVKGTAANADPVLGF